MAATPDPLRDDRSAVADLAVAESEAADVDERCVMLRSTRTESGVTLTVPSPTTLTKRVLDVVELLAVWDAMLMAAIATIQMASALAMRVMREVVVFMTPSCQILWIRG